MQKEIIFKKSTMKFVFYAIFLLLFLIVGKDMLSNSETLSNKQYVGAIILIILCPIGILILLYSLLFKRHIPVLIVNEEGYIHMGKYFAWWGQVKEIEPYNVNMPYGGIQRFIEVKLENIKTIPIVYEKYNFQVVSYTQHSKKKGKYITMSFSVANSNQKTKRVIEIMKQYKAEYDRLHKAENDNIQNS